MAKCLILAIVFVSALALEAQAAGIKGQHHLDGTQQQRIESVKGPRQQLRLPLPQQQPLLAVAAPARVNPLPGQAAKVGSGQVSPIFSSKRQQLQPQPSFIPIIQQQPQQQQQLPIQQIQQQQQQQEPEIQQQQQQQVESSEIDPNAAAQDSAPAIAAPASSNAESAEEANPRPEPYAFNYAFEAADSITSGSSQREEQQDANGRVTGFYTLRGQDGRDRRVDYIADASGFHATISTNEMGTAAKDSADARWQAQNPTDGQLREAESATQAARARALASPQQAQIASSTGASKILASPRLRPQQISQQRDTSADASLEQSAISQLQEPFEQIRQTELNSRARKSRHAPFYLYTV